MNYIKLVFTIDDRYQEQFIAELIDLDFYGFEQFDNKLIAYVEKPRYNDSHRELIEQMMGIYPGSSFNETEEIEEQNWNQTWENSIQPQRIGQFLVKPTWSDLTASGDEILLEIDPKMAFGTGYHSTTRLMLNYMGIIDFSDKYVLDAGTGTGILAIAAVKLGAKRAIGFDVDTWSEKNAVENSFINETDQKVDIRLGSIDVIDPDDQFDVILANINKNALITMLPELVKRAKPGADILLSGLLKTDEGVMREEVAKSYQDIVDIRQEDEWILLHLKQEK